MAAFTLRSAGKIAWREVQSSPGKFVFVLFSVAIGVAALTGVRGFSESFRRTLLLEARSIMAADLGARLNALPTPQEQAQLDSIAQQGVRMTRVTDMLSMASNATDPNPLLISLKAVDPAAYPFYGNVVLNIDDRKITSLQGVLTDTTVVVADDLLIRLHAKVGDSLRIGGKLFRIAALLVSEPDRLTSSMAIGPRVMMTQSALATTTLVGPGSHAGERYLFMLPKQSDSAVADVKATLEKALPEAQVTDFRESNPALTEGLDRSTSLLSLMSLVAMVLGAIGVAMAMRAHLQQRLDSIAIMKSLGATSSQIMRVYLLQTMLLGVVGGILGVGFGFAVQSILPRLLEGILHVAPPQLQIEPRAIAIGLATGVLTTLLFTLPPLLDIRNIRPGMIFRRTVEQDEGSNTAKLGKHRAQIVTAVIILAGLAAIASLLSDSAAVGGWFALGLVVTLGVLLGASALLLATLRRSLNRTRLHLPSSLRHGLANLYRPGNQSSAVLAALGTGVMLVSTVFLMQHAIVGELKLSSASNLPNIFMIDIAASEIDGVVKLLETQAGVRGPIERLPVITSRILSIDGTPAAQLKLQHFPRRMLQAVQLSYSETLPPGTKVLDGAWWQPGTQTAQIAIGKGTAQRIGAHIGSHIVFAAQDERIDAVVSTLIQSDGQHGYSRIEFILPKAPLAKLPAVWYSGVHIDIDKVGAVQRALYAAYPTITVINVADAMETIRGVVEEITQVIQFLAAFSIFAGVVILASSIAGTRYRRIREVVVLKTLGATRRRIATVFSVEFAILGLLAGIAGVGFANLLARILLHRMSITFHVEWLLALVILLGTMIVTNGTGWAASWRILGQKPLEVLREE